MRLFSFPAPPFILAFILGGMMEQAFRQSLTISNGSFMIFAKDPIALSLLAVALLSFVFPFVRQLRKGKESV
jgi:putative tricarboxylic transport membrane protein